jgi:HTH-type transcriptional regulator / antitoxin HigA
MDSEQLAVEWSAVPHPGETVMEYLEVNGWSQRDLARRTGLTPKTISEICNGKGPISPSTAIAFERALQRPAHFWLNLQRRYDEAVARRHAVSQLSGWDDWAKQFPIKEMRRLRYAVPHGRSDTDSLLSYFAVSSPDSWRSVWQSAGVRYRQTRQFKVSEEAVAAWVREVELTAREFALTEFNEKKLRAALPQLRRLTREPFDLAAEAVQNICSACGVAVVWVEALKNTGISGCTRWLSDDKVVIGLTFRGKYDDRLWFTFFHELGHVLLHRSRQGFVVDNALDDVLDQIVDPEMQQYENEANQFAADVLLPPRALVEFINERTFTNDAIHEFAERQDIGPGLVVGRLQREKILASHEGNALKQKILTRPAEEE